MISVLVADGYAIVRQGIRYLLHSTVDLALAGEVSDSSQLFEWLKSSYADLLVLDMDMAGPAGNELVESLIDKYPHIPILIFSPHREDHAVAKVIHSGVKGYLTKDSEPDAILAAIRQCGSGGYYIQPDLSMRLVLSGMFRQQEGLNNILSRRERQVFHMLIKGTPIHAIGGCLHISPKTVSAHKGRILQKLGVDTMTEMVRYAIRHKLMEP